MILPSKYFSLFCLLIIMGINCRQEPRSPGTDFWEEVELMPYQKTYRVGDTIWLHYFTNGNTLFDTISRQRMPADSLQQYLTINLFSVFSTYTPDQPPCEFVTSLPLPVTYLFSGQLTGASIIVDCGTPTAYERKLGVIMKQAGTYTLNLNRSTPVQPCLGKVNPYPGSLLHFTYRLASCNKDVYLSVPEANRQVPSSAFVEKEIDDKVRFAFKVE